MTADTPIHAGRVRNRVVLTAMGKLGELLPEMSPDQADALAAQLIDAARRARLHALEYPQEKRDE